MRDTWVYNSGCFTQTKAYANKLHILYTHRILYVEMILTTHKKEMEYTTREEILVKYTKLLTYCNHFPLQVMIF